MRKTFMYFSIILLGLSLAGCGDVTVNTPSRPRVIIEEKKEQPVIIEKTVVEKPVIVEKTTVEKPVIVIEKK